MRIALASLVLCASSSFAVAAPSAEAQIEVIPTGGTPILHATILGAPLLPASSITIRDGLGGAPIKAAAVVPYRDGPEAMTLAVVYAGGEVFVGNDDEEPEGPSRYPGFLHALETGLDGLHLKDAFPVGSKAIAIAYDDGTHVEVPLGPIATLTGAALGDQHHYRNRIGTDLVAGIEVAVAALAQSSTARRALIVIGDGNDTNNEAARATLAELKKRAAQNRIETFGIVYKGALSADETIITRMIPATRTRTIASVEALPAALTTIASQLTDERYYVTFPTTGLALDGRGHDLIVQVGDDQLEEVAVTLPAVATGCQLSGWWKQLGIGTFLVALLALGAMLTARLSTGDRR
ncbi:MAG: hypothetical protein NT062_18770 [Proteobacteria bacterium]|nr:hypothetical protein [Pseudomonadota bacterium]